MAKVNPNSNVLPFKQPKKKSNIFFILTIMNLLLILGLYALIFAKMV